MTNSENIKIFNSIYKINLFENDLIESDFTIDYGLQFHYRPEDLDYNQNQYVDMGLIYFGGSYPLSQRFSFHAVSSFQVDQVSAGFLFFKLVNGQLVEQGAEVS